MTLEEDGVLSSDELARLPAIPSAERLKQGAVAVIECAQEIPCNPCEEACPAGAIQVGEAITNLPVLASDQCTGCGLCIPVCPGLAIFVVDVTYSDREATVQLPYEFLPLPEKGEFVTALDREGTPVCPARVVNVRNPNRFDHTAVITIAIPKDQAMNVRNIALARRP